MKLFKNYFLPIILITFLILFSFGKVFAGFFQQDEWLSFSFRYLYSGSGILNIIKNAFTPSVGHFQPFNELVLQALFSVFNLNYIGYAAISLSLHIVNVILVYVLIKKIGSNGYLAFLTATLFGISASSYQSTSWVFADVGIHLAAIFVILSLIKIFDFVKTGSFKHLYISITCLVTSLMFKEIGLGLFGLLPAIILIFGQLTAPTKKRAIFYILTAGGVYLLIRFAMIYVPATNSKASSVFASQPVNYLFCNLLYLPFLAFTQSLVPSGLLINLLQKLAILSKNYSAQTLNSALFRSFLEGQALLVVCISVSLILVLANLFTFLKNRKIAIANNIILGILLVVFSSPIFALSPERIGIIYVLDSRNLYLPVLGTSITIVMGLFIIFKQNIKKTGIGILLLVFLNTYLLSDILGSNAQVGSTRKNILEEISRDIPILAPKTVFYTESDKSFYGLSETQRVMPFQSGFGQTLLIWYFDKQKLPKEFLENRFLWELTSEGYKEFQGTGFGYFRSFKNLVEAINKNNLSQENVFAMSYNSETNEIRNTTNGIRDRILGYFSHKTRLKLSGVQVMATENNENSNLMIDSNRHTFWISSSPYSFHQQVQLTFPYSVYITEIDVDSYENKDQGSVGYKLLASADGQNWEEIYNCLRCPPDDGGISKLYFRPTRMQYLKISQIGKHDYAPWVINELSIFQSSI